MAWQPLKDVLQWDDVGGRLLANLAKGIYNHQAVLREYVQNACDAYNLLDVPPAAPTITITPERHNLVIHDQGVGMDEAEIRAVKKIAVSTKADLEGMTGFRGIGIWAGFQACDELVVITTKRGVKKRFRLVIEFGEILRRVDENINIKELVDPRYHIAWEPAAAEDHYTQVTLKGVHKDYAALLDESEVRRIVSNTLPCRVDPAFQHIGALQKVLQNLADYQEFHINVVGKDGPKEAFRQFPSDPMGEPEEFVLKGDHGKELARGWFCRSQKTALRADIGVRGFGLRLRNFAVGPVNIYSDEDGSRFGVSAATRELRSTAGLLWFCGEIHVTDDGIVPNTPRDALEINAPARRLIEETRRFYKERLEDARAHSEFNGYRRSMDEAEKLIARLNGQRPASGSVDEEDVRRLLEKLEEADSRTRGKADGAAKEVLRKLLNRPLVKKARRTCIQQLRQLRSDGTPAKPAVRSTGTGSDSAGDKGKSGPGGTGRPSDGAARDVEAVVSEVVFVLEKHLGREHEGIAGIAEDIKRLLAARFGRNAEQPVP